MVRKSKCQYKDLGGESMINIIVAVAENGIIGGENRLLWHISEDLRHFKAITSGHPVVMGRKTYESLGRPLPNRENIVITRSQIEIEGCRVVHSLQEALDLFTPRDQIFIIGGAEIYRAAMPLADRFFLTRVHHPYEGDTSFPEWSEAEWECIKQEHHERGEKYEYPYTFEEYRRVAIPESDYYIGLASIEDAEQIREVAKESFISTYEDIVPMEQLEWMLEDMYSVDSIHHQIEQGHIYYFLFYKGIASGYFSLEQHPDGVVHLHKIYLSPQVQGLGFGRILIEHAFVIARRLCDMDRCRVELYVNRNNKAVKFYQHIGFEIGETRDYIIEDTQFVRPDYLLYKDLV